jgi:HK97 family phage prohead protease
MPAPENKQLETKRLPTTSCKLAIPETTTEEMLFSGYGAAFGNTDSYGDVIQKGAFADCLNDIKSGKLNWPAALTQHGGWGVTANDYTPVGIYTDLQEDDAGLKVEAKLADTERGIEIYKLMKMQPRPAIDGLSIGYYVLDAEYGGKNDPYERLIKKIELVEISIVTFPANGKARVTDVKSANQFTERDFERLMQDAGFSRSQARDVMNHGFKSFVSKRDAASEDEIKAITAVLNRNIEILNA